MSRFSPFKYVLFLFIAISALTVSATHIVGGVMNYTYLGNDKFEISLYVYRDCIHGIPPLDDPAIIRIWDGVSEQYSFVNVPFDDTLPPLPPDACAKITTPVCVNWTRYRDTLVLPPNDLGYTIYYQRCCRNNTIQNLTYNSRGNGAMDWGATYSINIPPSSTQGQNIINSSPVFKNYPPIYICVNKPINYDNSAIDADGDSLVYSLCTPYSGAYPNDPLNYYSEETPPFEEVQWAPGYSVNNMLGGTTPLQINPVTGVLTGTPNTMGQFVVGVCVDEYRKGELLTHTTRDFQFNIIDCNLQVVSSFFAPKVQCNNFTVDFQNQSSGATDYKWYFGDGDSSTATNPTHTYRDTGRYNVTLVSINTITNSCKAEYTQKVSIQYKKIVADFSTAVATCISANDSIKFLDRSTDAFNIANWKWNFSTGDSSVQKNPSVRYNGIDTVITATLTVTSTNGCTSSNTKSIRLFPKPHYNLNPIITKCTNTGVAQIILNMSGNNIFSWTPTTGLNNATLQSPTTNINTNTTYYVTIKTPLANGDTCVQYDSVQVQTINTVQINATDTLKICNDSVRLYVPLSAGQSVIWSTSNTFNPIIGNSASISIYQTKAEQKYYVQISAQECNAIDSILVMYNDTIPTITLAKSVLQCSNQVNLNATVNYQTHVSWSTNSSFLPVLSNNTSLSIIQPTKTVKYYLKAEYKTCSSIDSVKVTIQDTLPLISLADTLNFCGGNLITINATVRKYTALFWSDMPDFSTNLGNSPQLTVTPATTSKKYYLKAFYRDCSVIDSVVVNYNNTTPSIVLEDSLFSCSKTIHLQAQVTNGQQILWSLNPNFSTIISTNPVIDTIQQTNSIQKYYIKAINGFCIAKDSITVKVQNAAQIRLKDTLWVCADSVRLHADITNFDSLHWATTLGFTTVIGKTPTIVIAQTDEEKMYYLKVFNAGCTTIDSVHVFYSNEAPTISLSSPVNFCTDTVFAYAFANPYTEAEWFDSRDLSHLIGTNLTLQITQPIGEHWYYFRAKNKYCTSLDSIKISNNAIKYRKPEIAVCIGQKATIHLQIQTNSEYKTTWVLKQDTITTIQTDSVSFTPTSTQTIYFKVENSRNCTIEDSIIVSVLPAPLLHATVDKPVIYEGEQVQLNATQNNNYIYHWMPTEIVSSASIYNPIASPTQTTTFTVIVTDINTCSNKDTITVTVLNADCSSKSIYMPNAFSPNGDGINDVFMVRSSILKNMHLEIYDRWGNRVFETNNLNEGWNGTYKGQQAAADAYGYYFSGECLQGKKITLKGNVTLLK